MLIVPSARPAVLAAALVLVACVGPSREVTLQPSAAGLGTPVTLLVATSREPEGSPLYFGSGRARVSRFARFTVSVPPNRSPGTINWPTRVPGDPRTDFLTISAERIPDARAFVAAINAELRRKRGREAVVFVHGYNTSFAAGLYRQAQMHHDFKLPDTSIHYSWPSAGRLTGYVYDKESAIFGAEGLADLLELLATTNIDQIALVGHSMGGFVVMEALRLLALRGSSAAFGKLHAVVLLAPDEDIDIFRQRMATLRARDLPVYIFASSHDRALRTSSRLQGRRARLGALTDPAMIEDLPVYLLDISDVASSDPYRHNNVATSPLMTALVKGFDKQGIQTFDDFARGSSGLADLTVHAVQQATQVVVEPIVSP